MKDQLSQLRWYVVTRLNHAKNVSAQSEFFKGYFEGIIAELETMNNLISYFQSMNKDDFEN